MTLELVVTVCIRFVAVVGALQLLLNVIGTNVYELQKTKRHREYNRHPHARHLRTSPLVSVVVVARNNDKDVEHCLASLMRSTYRKFEIIIVDNNSHDRTRRVVNKFKAEHPNRQISLFAKRVVTERFDAARAGYRKYGNGEVITVISADQTIDRRALSLAVTYFKTDPSLQVLTTKLRTSSAYSSLGVLQKYHELVAYRLRKWDSAFGSDYALQPTVMCRRGALRLIANPKRYAIKPKFADEVVVYAAAPASIDELTMRVYSSAASRAQALINGRRSKLRFGTPHELFFGWFRLPLAVCSGLAALLLPFLIGYISYIALKLHEPTFLLSAAGLVSLLIVFAVWDDQQLGLKQKLAYTFGIPLTFGPLIALTVVQASAIAGTSLAPGKRSFD